MCPEIPTLEKEVVQGSRLTFPVSFQFDGHDFTGSAVTCVFKTDISNPDVLSSIDASMTYPSTGNATAVIDILGTVTASWPAGTVIGEIKIVQTGADFGPYRPARVLVTVLQQIAP